jgi:hypothetical protein
LPILKQLRNASGANVSDFYDNLWIESEHRKRNQSARMIEIRDCYRQNLHQQAVLNFDIRQDLGCRAGRSRRPVYQRVEESLAMAVSRREQEADSHQRYSQSFSPRVNDLQIPLVDLLPCVSQGFDLVDKPLRRFKGDQPCMAEAQLNLPNLPTAGTE